MKKEYAFPHENNYKEKFEGMTLRDYFAAKAMQMEMQSTKEYYNNGECDVSEWSQLFVNIAEQAYLMADEMMEARKA